jgi:hypothetical protein
MISLIGLPVLFSVIFFVVTALDSSIPTPRKKHALAILFGIATFAGAIAQPVHHPWLYLTAGTIAGMNLYRFAWEALQSEN